MSKTVDQIASDCGLWGADLELLRQIVENEDWTPLQPMAPVGDGFCDIIQSLCGRVLNLEDEKGISQTNEILLYLDDIGYGNSSLPSGDNVLEALRGMHARIQELEAKVDELWVSECEDIFLVSQTCNGGKWNKLVKSHEQWWYSERAAQGWLDQQEDWFKASNKVFKCRINLTDIQRTQPNE